jgi:hypothetical protein
MNHGLHVGQRRLPSLRVSYIAANQLHGTLQVWRHILIAGVDLRIEVVEHHHLLPLMQKAARELCSDKTGSSCNQYFHATSLMLNVTLR